MNKRNEVPVIDDIDEDYVTDEPVIKDDEQPEKEEDAPTVLPMYAKYLQVQKDNPDRIVVFQVGDFYEIMGDKAEQAASILDLTLTSRNVGLPEKSAYVRLSVSRFREVHGEIARYIGCRCR
ncbi:MAG: hypothetical protein L6V85_08340 [Clostridiales bacterium]|nr:MAG: hypothetical protein L6V85_08340 [Clostridiales bacterium]